MLNIDKEELKELYCNKQMSTRDIAKYYNCGQTTIRRKMKLYDIKTRTSSEGQNTSYYLNKMQPIFDSYSKEYKRRSIENGHRIIKTCPFCQKEFECPKYSKSKYCSRECSNNAKKKKNYCVVCNKQINLGTKYCKDCLKEHKSKISYNRIKTQCGYCKKDLYIIPSVFKQREKHYCDVNCMAKDYSLRFSGENSPSWKGGKRHYQGHWLSQRMLALQRDNNTCQLCGKKSEEQNGISMSVHHINNYRNYTNKLDANNLDNLICLCHNCHSFVHSNKNTKNIFINNKIQSNLIGDNK